MKIFGQAMRLARIAMLVPLYALYGAWTIVRATLGAFARAGDAMNLLRASMLCPSCRAPNLLAGRWKCRSCGATYHGIPQRCERCHAAATWFPCARCGISIPLGGA